MAFPKTLKFRKPKYRTIEVVPFGTTPDDARILNVSLLPDAKMDPLVYVVVGSIVISFMFNSLDTVTNSPAIRKLIVDYMNWGTLYLPFFPNRLWAPITVMWFHGSWEHLIGNMLGLYVVALWLSRVYASKAWRLFFFVAGSIAGIVFVYMFHSPAADFSNWHGPLAAITSEPNTPLAGASGGDFALIGAALAAVLRYGIARMPSWMQISIPILLALPAVQFLCVDWGNAGIAGLAHVLALVFGFILGLFPRLKGRVTILSSCPEAISVDSVTIDDRTGLVMGAVYSVSSQFDDSKDFLIKKQDYLGLNTTVPSFKMLGGTRPADGAVGSVIPLYVAPWKVPPEAYKKILQNSKPMLLSTVTMLLATAAISQFLFAKYSAPGYPSIFVANLLIGAVMIGEFFHKSRKFLTWQPPHQSASASSNSGHSTNESVVVAGRWEVD